jgi:hypothetical protein
MAVIYQWVPVSKPEWYVEARPALIVEQVLYLFGIACLSAAVAIHEWPLVYIYPIAIIGTTAIVASSSVIGHTASPKMIVKIRIKSWFIPVGGRFHSALRVPPVDIQHSVPRIPAIDIHWSAKNSLTTYEKSMAIGVYVSPVIVVLLTAFIVRVIP